MVYSELNNKMRLFRIDDVQTMDVYEYTDKVMEFLGDGKLLNIRAEDRRPFLIEEFGSLSPYYGYHSVIMIVCDDFPFVVDVAARSVVQHLSNYLSNLSTMNRGRIFCSEVSPYFGKATGESFSHLYELDMFN